MVLWFLDTAGIGSIIVFVVAISVFLIYVRMLRWIQTTPPDPDSAEAAAPSEVKR
jgi:hypothetical protein